MGGNGGKTTTGNRCGSPVVSGFDLDADRDGIWTEGTCQSILAFQIAGRQQWANTFLRDMTTVQELAYRTNRKGLVAALRDCLTTSGPYYYYNRLHLAPTAWYIFAAQRYNPYWGAQIPDPTYRVFVPLIPVITP